MKKYIVPFAALLPLVSFAQESVTFNVGKAHNCLSMGRGCVHGESNTITFNVEKIEENIITLSISTVGLSEEDQYFLIGDELANIGDESYSTQEEDYYFSEEEKTILNLKGDFFLSKGKYPVKVIDNKLYLELRVSNN